MCAVDVALAYARGCLPSELGWRLGIGLCMVGGLASSSGRFVVRRPVLAAAAQASADFGGASASGMSESGSSDVSDVDSWDGFFDPESIGAECAFYSDLGGV